jgi:hypothetical protein
VTPEQQQKCTIAYEDYKQALKMGQQPVEWSLFKAGYEACLDNGFPVPEGYFRIGEEVDFRCKKSAPFTQATVELVSERGNTFSFGHMAELEVRRRPAWEPKDEEAVFALGKNGVTYDVVRVRNTCEGVVYIVASSGYVHEVTPGSLKPFDASKIGLPWSEL